MFEKTRNLPLVIRIILTLILSVGWIYLASGFDMETQTNWLISTLAIAFISSIFFPFSSKGKSD
jgi:hypothetical protein